MEDERDSQEELETPTETVALNPRKRTMESRSDVLDHYDKVKDWNVVLVKVKCKYCAKDLSANTSRNGTSSLCNHLETCKSFNVEGRQIKLAFELKMVETQHWVVGFLKRIWLEKNILRWLLLMSCHLNPGRVWDLKNLWLPCNQSFKFHLDGWLHVIVMGCILLGEMS